MACLIKWRGAFIATACVLSGLLAGCAQDASVPTSAYPPASFAFRAPEGMRDLQFPAPSGMCIPDETTAFGRRALENLPRIDPAIRVGHFIPCQGASDAQPVSTSSDGERVTVLTRIPIRFPRELGPIDQESANRMAVGTGKVVRDDVGQWSTELRQIATAVLPGEYQPLAALPPDATGNVVIGVYRTINGLPLLRLDSMIALDDQIYILSDAYGAFEQSSRAVSDLLRRQRAWIAEVRQANPDALPRPTAR